MERKRILFVASHMIAGGAEKALIGMLQVLSPVFEIDLHLLYARGEFLEQISQKIHIEEIKPLKRRFQLLVDAPKTILMQLVTHGEIAFALKYLFAYIKSKRKKNQTPLFKLILGQYSTQRHYDMAIAYTCPLHYLEYYVLHNVNSARKILWIHTDVKHNFINTSFVDNWYAGFDKIFCVSEQGKTNFDKRFPHLAGKTDVFHNIISSAQVLRMADEYRVDFNAEATHIVTVGRMSLEKGQDIALHALRLLVDSGANVQWHFVGGGKQMEKYHKLAQELGLMKHVDFTGTLTNPYPYMKHATVYVQPSRHEGYCITLAEARLFGMPIVATEFAGAHEQLDGRTNATITSHEPSDIAQSIRWAMKQKHITVTEIVEHNDLHKLLALL